MASPQTEEINDQSLVVDLVAGVVLVIASLLALFWIIPTYVVEASSANDVGPAYFPKLSAWSVLVLSLVHLTLKVFESRAKTPSTSGLAPSHWFVLFEALVWVGVSVFSMVGLAKIGFLFVAPLLVLAGAYASGYRRWGLILTVMIILPLVIYQIAWTVFVVELP